MEKAHVESKEMKRGNWLEIKNIGLTIGRAQCRAQLREFYPGNTE